MFETAETMLVFTAKMNSDYKEDEERVFAVQYFLADKRIQVLEAKNLKKGIPGDRFLAKMHVKDPRTQQNYDDDAFFVGATLVISGREFVLTDAPEHTLCQMEANSKRFPQSDLQRAIEQVASVGVDAIQPEFVAKDPESTGAVLVNDAVAILAKFEPAISKQVGLTLKRRFSEGADFHYGEMISYTSQV